MFKFPRTPHVIGSHRSKDDEDVDYVRLSDLQNKHVVITEKVDGANCGISFDETGKLLLQSRGHYLTGGRRERQFNLLKAWANTILPTLRHILGTRYIMFGEWMYAKHTEFYDCLPHHFLEFDIYDKILEVFLSSTQRKELLSTDGINSVHVIHNGILEHHKTVSDYISVSHYKTNNNCKNLELTCKKYNLDFSKIFKQTSHSSLMEGVYVKVEDDNNVLLRCKHVRASFTNLLNMSSQHWSQRPIVPNLVTV